MARKFRSILLGCVVAVVAMLSQPRAAHPAEKVTLATNWLAQPELGGFYQALADGTYARHGLDVTIKPGGPMVNNRPLLAFGRVDFLIGTNLLQAFDAVKQRIPTKVVAAFFQKDPQCILAHADGPHRTWDDLKRAPLLMGNSGRQTFFQWMNAAHGFPRANLRPYNHNLAPFLNDKTAAMQGFATAEPKRVEEATGREPRVFLLADYGWSSYSTVLETRIQLIEKRPELVQRFVDASIIGWERYLAGEDTAAADALIKKENPAMTDGQIAYSRTKMRELELLGPSDEIGWHALRSAEGRGESPAASPRPSKTLGVPPAGRIGEIDVQRVRDFYKKMVATGMFKADDIRPEKAVTVEFVSD